MTVPSTIDPAEAARFERLAQSWWDPAGPFWPLHRLNGLRANYIRDRLSVHFGRDAAAPAPLAGLKLLDIGCGGGLLSEAMARQGADVLGVDMVERNIRIAERHGLETGLPVRYQAGTAEDLARGGAAFDAVLNLEVVEHVADLPLFMAATAALVKPGGLMVLATLNRTLASFLLAIVGAEYVLRWLPRGTHRWDRFVTPEELERLLLEGNMQITDRTGVRVNPFTRRFSLSAYMGVNYMLVARK